MANAAFAAPLAPIPEAPADNANTTAAASDFRWSAPACTVVFQWQTSLRSDFTTTIADVHTAVRTHWPPVPLSRGKYFWRVRAMDQSGAWGPWSAVRAVNINTITPQPVSPAGNAMLTEARPLLKTTAVDRALAYQFAFLPGPDANAEPLTVFTRRTNTW